MQRYGASSIAQVMLSNTWYLENMPRFKAALEDGTLQSIPRDGDVKADLRALVVERGIPKLAENARSRTSDGGQRHGDAAIALALAWFATNQGGGPIEYTEVPRRPGRTPQRDFMRAPTDDDRPRYGGRGDW